MKIIIAGAGAVGTHLAKMLSKEKHTIVLLDEKTEKIKQLESSYEILAVVGSPTSLKDLREAQVPSADLFVAVTPYESTNITACLLATNLGAQKTLARIDNQEYLLPKNKEFFKSMGVDSLIYPERLAADEIVNGLKKGWVRQYLEFSDGELVVLATKIRESSPLCDQQLMHAFQANNRLRVVVIKRGNETIIPTGKDQIKVNDIVYFLTTREGTEEVRILSGKEEFEIGSTMFLGASRIGVRAIQELPSSMNIKVIEQDKEKSMQLLEKTDKALVINGDGRDISLLKEEDIESYDAFVALSGNSETNILACLAAKNLGVKRTIAEVENNDYISMAESLDIGAIINKKIIAASHIYQLILGGDVSVKCLTFVDVLVVELMAEDDSAITKDMLKNLKLPKNTTIGGIVRNDKGIVAVGDTQIQAGDRVLVFCGEDTVHKIEKLFK
ncbi:MAG: Trk system potassium transporter TrkA [Paludibacteraceae bacterium]|jgi:trk system potassium uptake protein TrkA|nr:Trk system potassium transporter TrkA [Paludibacteraceae bacterium]